MSEPLDPLTLPLHGSRLIEASAGTGKTWTIAALVLRLVLADGAPATADIAADMGEDADEQPLARPLLPAEILVMTFTKAATRELSDRIRRRLVEAAACFRGDAVPAADDDFLPRLLLRHPPGPRRAAAAWRLAAAAEAMDDAAVFTIDAWCQRMLREHAFDSGCLFDEELQASEAAVIDTAVRDYWRQQVYPLPPDALAVVLDRWPGVDALARTARGLLEDELPPGAGHGSLLDCITATADGRAAQVAALKQGWPARCGQMLAWLEREWAEPDGRIDKKILIPHHARRWIAALSDWAGGADAVAPDLGKGADRLTDAGIRAALRPGAAAGTGGVELPSCFVELAALQQALQALTDPAAALVAHAGSRIAERVQQLKAQAGRYGFADMLRRLHDALDEAAHGDTARRLRARILRQYPAALIDEFQDTSPLQLVIFDRLYRIADNAPARVLLLIGDPKQSIYGFRGADIHSYLLARGATRGRHHMLDTNHRATAPLVSAVNALFDAAEQRPGAGAFLFGPDGGDADGGLPFVPVQAAGRPEQLVTAAGNVPAVTLWLDAVLRSQSDSRAAFAAVCAESIVALLNDAAAGFAEAAPCARTRRGAAPRAAAAAAFRRLRPADIAVLVRTGTEAVAVRQALRLRGVASVYLSDKDNVFASAEAPALLRLLQAVASPRSARLVRAALATPLLALPLAELVALASDDALFDARCALLQQLHAVWQAQGVLAMLRRALHGLELPARWLAAGAGEHQPECHQPEDRLPVNHQQEGGERRLTNVLHLAELLQTASTQFDGEQALIRWLSQSIADAAAGAGAFAADDAEVLRLESDADLVQVVTVHKSKGLEYPLVFLPFAAACRPVDRRNTAVVSLPAAQGGRALALSPTPEQLAAADRERLREDLRLLYVALTRARHAVWVGASALKVGKGGACVWHRSALGSLLSGAAARTADEVAHDVRAWRGCDASVDVHEVEVDTATGEPLAQRTHTRLQARGGVPPLAPALRYTAQFDRLWTVTSYSALVKDLRSGAGGMAGGGAADGVGDGGDTEGGGNVPPRMLRDDEPPGDGAGTSAGGTGNSDSGGDDAGASGDRGDRAAGAAPWHRFPRGAVAGNFLHGLLEWLAGEGFALDGPAAPQLQQALQRRCIREGWGHRGDDVLAWLQRVCTTPLPPTGAALSQLDVVLPEMEFWLPSDGLEAGAVDALCRAHLLPGRPRPALPERSLRGMLMGFADLVFLHGGRYWVLDYKSNALGAGSAAYGTAAMEHAMLEHRYDVQAALYLLALHRLLRQRLGAAYRPAQHLGGAVYLFLRGIGSPGAGCFHQPPPLTLIAGLEALLDGAKRTAVHGEPP